MPITFWFWAILAGVGGIYLGVSSWKEVVGKQAVKRLRRAGKYAEATLLQKQLEIDALIKTKGPDNPLVSPELFSLALMYEKKCNYQKAEVLYKRALAIWEKSTSAGICIQAEAGAPFSATEVWCKIAAHLAGVYCLQGKHIDAEPLFSRALEFYDVMMDQGFSKYGDPEELTERFLLISNNLGCIYRDQGKHPAAESLFSRVIAIYENAGGLFSALGAAAMENLGQLYDAQGKPVEAEALVKRAIAVFEDAVGPEDVCVARSLNVLAGMYFRQGRYAEAELIGKRAMAISENVLGPDHQETIALRESLAALLNMRLAKPSLSQEPVASKDSQVLAATNQMLAFYESGNYAETERLARNVLALREESDGPDSPKTVEARNVLAWACVGLKKYDEAVLLYSRNCAISEKAHGPDSLETSGFLNDVGLACTEWARVTRDVDTKSQRFEMARTALLRAVGIRVNKAGSNDMLVAEAYNNLALAAAYERRFEEAEKWIVLALRIDELVLGPDHSLSKQIRVNLDCIRHDRQALSVLGGTELRAIKSLTVEQARSLSEFYGLLDLVSMTEITDSVAEALAHHKGLLLDLSGVTELTTEAAKALAQHERGLILDGLVGLPDDTVAALANHRGNTLSLNGLTSLSVNAATSLAGHKGVLVLGGVNHLSSEEAAALAKHKGVVCLFGLTHVPTDGLAALRANPEVRLPESLQ